jgi:hypothetical protein
MNIKDDISKALNEASKATERSLRSRLDEYYQQIVVLVDERLLWFYPRSQKN